MDGKLRRIKDVLLFTRNVSLSKQCTKEYIVYTFILDNNKEYVIRQIKGHYADRNLDKSYSLKRKKIRIPVEDFINTVVKDLVLSGYTLELYED